MSLLLEALAIAGAIAGLALVLRRLTGRPHWPRAAAAVILVVAGAMSATYSVTSGRALLKSWREARHLTPHEQVIRAGRRLSVNVEFVEWLRRRIPPRDSYYLIQGARPHPSRRLFEWTTFRLLPRLQRTSPRTARWLVLYGATPRSAGARARGFGSWRAFAPTQVLGRRRAP